MRIAGGMSMDVLGSLNPRAYSPVGNVIQRAYHPYITNTNNRAFVSTVMPGTYAMLTEFMIPGACSIRGLMINGTSTALAGTNMVGKFRLYERLPSGRPGRAISAEVSNTFTATTYYATPFALPAPVAIPKKKSIIIASIFDPAGWTTWSFITNANSYFDEYMFSGFANKFGEQVSSAALTFAGGLPDDMTTLPSPTYTGLAYQLDYRLFTG